MELRFYITSIFINIILEHVTLYFIHLILRSYRGVKINKLASSTK